MGPFKSLRATVEDSTLAAREAILAHKADKQTLRKTVVLIEGVDDRAVYSVFLNEEHVDFKDCNGCLNVEKQHSTLKRELKSRFITILDSDFKRLEGIPKHDENLFYTDYHDSEMQMLSNNNIMDVVFKRLTSKPLRDPIVAMAEKELYNWSMLKWFNTNRRMKYRFENIDLVNLANGKVLSVNTALQYITPSAKYPKCFPKQSFDKFLVKNEKNADDTAFLLQVTNGHDMVSRMAGILKHKYNCQVSDSKLRECICRAFTIAHARKSQLYVDIQKWCKKENVLILK